MPIQPSAQTVPLLRALALALRAVDKQTRADISRESRATMNPVWREAIATHAAGNRMDYAVLGKGARIAPGNPARAIAGSSRRGLRKGTNPFIPDAHWRAIEFGAYKDKTATYTRTFKGGKAHQVTRRTNTGLPKGNRKGRVIFPAFAEVAPRMVSLWTQIVVRNIHEALEKR